MSFKTFIVPPLITVIQANWLKIEVASILLNYSKDFGKYKKIIMNIERINENVSFLQLNDRIQRFLFPFMCISIVLYFYLYSGIV